MINELPDSPAISKLAEALWRQDAKRHGAAIMIGAGFSRCSSKHADGAKKLPLWKDFAKKLASELDGKNKDLAFSDPLRLAEEYRAYFGQVALNDLIRSEIHDEAWQPGALHSDLLSLPWSEVMTTNWDTLLERAALNIHAPIYGVVSKQSDLSCIRSPRIVKLHGSIGVTEQFIFAQEDYRKYPHEFAAFVNFARQVFIENELCLIGFSGDDPNFLQWAGWVRDNLADHARRIYLVGVLKLSAAKRKLLESINIAPIDLWETVKEIDDPDLQHQRAMEMFLKALLDAAPKRLYEWQPTSLHRQQVTEEELTLKFKDHAHAASLLERQVETLRRDRETYPGWLVCPPELRRKIQSQISDPYPNASNIACLEPNSRAKLLYEIAWQHVITFAPVASWLAIELANIANPTNPCAITKRQQLEVALLLLKTARQNDSLSEFAKWAALLEKHALHLPDCSAEIAYQQALMARDHFDYPGVESVVEKVIGEDPVWKLKQASLLAELGRFDEGERLVSEAYKDLLDRSRHDPNSIRIYSRLAWAHWLFRLVDFSRNYKALEKLPNTYEALRCDPWDQFTHIREKASKQQEEYFKGQESIEPLFEQGHYRDHSNDTRFTSEISPFFLLDGLADSVGLTLHWENMVLLSDVAEQLVVSKGLDIGLHNFTLAIRAASSDSSTSIKQIFSRIALANTPQNVVDTLSNRLISAIAYWRKQASAGTVQQKRHAIDAIRVLIEVLARLAIRLSPEESKKVFQLAVAFGRDSALRHFWLFEVIGHLAQYSLESIPDAQQSDLLLDALSFPLPCEIGIDKSHEAERWPNLVISAPCKRESNPRLDARISELIEFVVPGSPSCTSVLLRLLPLAENATLTNEELDKLAIKLWGEKPDYKTLPNTGLYSHALLTLPAIDRSEANALMSSLLFDTEDALFITSVHLSGLTGAAASKTNPLLPNSEQAAKCFDRLVMWRPSTEDDDPLGMRSREKESLIEDISEALSYSITPSLTPDDITTQRFEKVLAFCTDVGAFPVIIALTYFTRLNTEIASIVEKAIRKGMQGRTAHEVGWSAHALHKWKELAAAGKAPLPPDNLLSKMIYLIESGRSVGLHSLLGYAGEMLKKNWLSPADVSALADCVPDLFDAADYSNIRPSSREAITASLIREVCIKLAGNLMNVAPHEKLKAMIEAAKDDTLPEVRFAG
ncbi:SIR2 family protein [Thiobacillus sp.]|uniref:SIR2 family protein n=1 Tax=Thiobacillus sp. TaxID=924 RepID=UPI00286DDE9E|nr:SIR2 family protein [Thiobacillus sp.]